MPHLITITESRIICTVKALMEISSCATEGTTEEAAILAAGANLLCVVTPENYKEVVVSFAAAGILIGQRCLEFEKEVERLSAQSLSE